MQARSTFRAESLERARYRVTARNNRPRRKQYRRVRRLIEKFRDWFFYSELDDCTGPTIFYFSK